jgi:D-beta-D-heptose 7-phosphate kinase/D-beta-D-heptose 1-phosphate adenosyltransferase
MIIDIEDLKQIKINHPNKKIVLGLGTFDMFHYEHLRYLIDAKKLGDILVVAIKDNNTVKSKEQNRPIIDESQRVAIVDELKCVDYTVLITDKVDSSKIKEIFDIDTLATLDWLVTFYKVFDNLRPDILYHENTTALQYGREQISKLFNVKLIERERTAIISTSKIIDKIQLLK